MKNQALKIIILCICTILMVNILMVNFSLATNDTATSPITDLAIMDFEVKETGITFFSILLSNPKFNSDLSIPDFDSKVLRVYTVNNKELDYNMQNSSIIIHPGNLSNISTITIELSSQRLTSKEGSNWRFYLASLDGLNAEDVIIEVTMPYNSTIKAHSEPAFISSENDYITVEWFLSNELAKDVLIQYTINSLSESPIAVNKEEEKGDSSLFSVFFIIIAILAVILIGLAIITRKLFNKEKAYVSDLLIGHEKDIVKLLRKSGNRLTQKKIRLELHMPKSTLSRTLKRLEQRNIISIKNIGQQNLIILKK